MPNANGRKSVDLDRVLNEYAGEVTVGGRTYQVRPLDARGMQLARSLRNGEGDPFDNLYRLAELCLPSMSPEDVEKLVPVQIQAVVDVASSAVREVEESAGNPPKARAKRARKAPSPA